MSRRVFIVQDDADPACPWAVKEFGSDTIIARAASESDAARFALDAADMASDTGTPFVAVLCVEGYDTGDGRYLEPGMGGWRTLPQPLMAQTTVPEMGGHAGAVLAGRIDTIRMDGRRMMAEGVFDAGPDGSQAARLVHDRMLRFVSIDMAEADVTVEPVAYDDAGYPTATLARFGPYTIMGATATPHPAIDLAVIWLQSDPAPEEAFAMLPDPLGPPKPMPDGLMASAEPTLALLAAGMVKPPAAWFTDPHLDALTPLETTDEGRIFGHVAPWGGCHIGFLNKCVEPPHGGDYSYFLTGEVLTADGTRIPTGTLTVYAGHADEHAGPAAARAHYDNAALACADVTVGEDRHGIWVAGAVRPGITDEQLRVMRGSAPSGDWRPIGGRLELINVHYVNTPGFPVPRMRARVASGELVGLVASIGNTEPAEEEVVEVAEPVVEAEPVVDTSLADRLGVIERAIAPLIPIAHAQIADRIPAEPSVLERYLAGR